MTFGVRTDSGTNSKLLLSAATKTLEKNIVAAPMVDSWGDLDLSGFECVAIYHSIVYYAHNNSYSMLVYTCNAL